MTPYHGTDRIVAAVGRKTRVMGATGGALGLSGLAALLGFCCSLPWVVALLGVTGAVAFARLAYVIPYALIGSALLLAVGFWLAYRRPAACVQEGGTQASQRALRWIVWATTAIVAALATVALRYV